MAELNGLRVTSVFGKTAIEMSNSEVGLKRYLSYDQIGELISELEAARDLMADYDDPTNDFPEGE